MSSTPRRSAGSLPLAIALALAAGSPHAATITVIDGGDSGGTSATCMLRQAIATIAANATTGTGCFNSGDDFGSNDTIVFGDTLTAANITLSLGQLSVSGLTAALTIQGSGQTIDANKLSRVLYAKSSTLTISSLTLTGGSASLGGGVYATNSTVTLSYSAVSGNSSSQGGGGVEANNSSAVTLTSSSVSGNSTSGNGGGVSASNSSTVTLTNSTVSGNSSSASGGGVHAVASTVTLTDSTLSGNSAFAGGGGYTFNFGTVKLTNSTVSGNSAHYGGGLFAVGYGTMTLTSSTVSGNSASSKGGGLYAFNHGVATLTNSILSANTAPSLPDLHASSSSISISYSLLGTTLDTPSYNDPGNHNIFSDVPGLGALANNGGLTQTMALTENSPGLNAGDPALAVDPITLLPLNYDQRGSRFPRTLPDGTIDIGAYQHQGGDRMFASGFESGP